MPNKNFNKKIKKIYSKVTRIDIFNNNIIN